MSVRAADDFAAIGARLAELASERVMSPLPDAAGHDLDRWAATLGEARQDGEGDAALRVRLTELL